MKIHILIIFTFIINIYAQFTSGLDYSGEDEKIKHSNECGFAIYTVKSDIKWDFADSESISFSANSNMTGFGYGLFLNLPSKTYDMFFKADHLYKDISNSASKNEYLNPGEDPVFTNIETSDFSLNQIRAEAGLDLNQRYKFTAAGKYLSDEDKSSFQFKGYAGYKITLDKSQFITAGIAMSSEGNKDLLALREAYSDICPYQSYSAGYVKEFSTAEINSNISFLKYYSSSVKDRETDYFNFELTYNMSFKTAETNVSISAGSNLTKDFTSPYINLPYFYYNARFGTDLLDSKIGLNIGWNYGMYKITLSDRITINEDDLLTLPAGVEEISENIGSYTLDIELSYRF